jgi:hypothetical protein
MGGSNRSGRRVLYRAPHSLREAIGVARRLGSRRSNGAREVISALEPRRLLAFVYTATEGPDVITVRHEPQTGVTQIVHQGGPGASTAEDHVVINLLGGNDQVLVETLHDSLDLQLGDGSDTVQLGGAGYDLPFLPVTIAGGAQDDAVVFNDGGGGQFGRLYNVTPTGILDTTLSGVEDVTINARPASASLPNQFEFTGFPAANSVTVNGPTAHNRFLIGTPDSRVDLDSAGVDLIVNAAGPVSIYAREDDASVDPYYFYTSGSPAAQRIDHGSFSAALADPALDLLVSASESADAFNFADQRAGTDIEILGNGGDDTVQTVNYAGHTKDNDFDEVFRAPLRFFGGPGTDTLDLNDSADETGDGDATYYIHDDWIVKGLFPHSGSADQALIRYDWTTERLNLVAGGVEDNTFWYKGHPQQTFTIDAGGGDDVLRNGHFLVLCRASVVLVGGPGNDRVQIEDENDSLVEYRFDPYEFSYFAGRNFRYGGIAYDDTLEKFDLLENRFGWLFGEEGITRLNGKSPGLKLTVTARTANDIFILGGGDLDNSGFTPETVTIIGGLDSDVIRFEDYLDDHSDNSTESETYVHTFDPDTGLNKLIKGAAGASFSQIEDVQIGVANRATGSSVPRNTIDLNSFAPDVEQISVYGGSVRPNTVNIATGNLDALAGRSLEMHLVGSPGDVVNINDQGATFPNAYVLERRRLSRSPGGARAVIIDHDGIDQLNINAGPYPDVITIAGMAQGTAVTAHGNGGNDRFNVGDGAAWANIDGTSALHGGAGNDQAVFTVSGTSGATATLSATGVSVDGGPVQSYSGVESLAANFGAGNDDIQVTGGTFTVNTGAESGTNPAVGDALSIDPDYLGAGDEPATVRLAGPDRLAKLTVAQRGTLEIPSGAVLYLSGTLSLGGVIDLSGGSLIHRNTAGNLGAYAGWIKTGYAGGAWNGGSPAGLGAINSLLAAATSEGDGVGYAAGSQVAVSSIGPFAVAAEDLVARHTLLGDANLDRTVGFADLVAVAQNYGTTGGATWARGDFNYDGNVDFADLVPLAQNYGATLPETGGAAAGEIAGAAAGRQAAVFSTGQRIRPAAPRPRRR